MSDVSYELPQYIEALEGWQRTIAACTGEEAVKKIPNVLPYLNKADLSAQNVERNASYMQRAVYFNATGRTLEGLIGLAFARAPDVNFGNFDYLATDANGDGFSIYHVAQQGLAGVLQTGRHGFLADMVNEKPTIVGYNSESIINWRVNTMDGKRQLTLLVLKECLQEEEDEYGSKDVVKYREFRLVDGVVVARVWIAEGNGAPKLDTTPIIQLPHATKKMTEIPFAFCGAQNNSPTIQAAPLRGLAEMNLAHFRDSADYQDSVFFCGQVQPWISGLDEAWRDKLLENGLYVGSRSPIPLPQGGQFGFAQAQPNTLAKEAMTSKESLMVALGARVVEQSPITKTATQAAGDIATSTSVLGLCTGNVSTAMTRSLQWLGLYDNAQPFAEAKFDITKDFTQQTLDAQKLTALVQAWQAGAFSRIDLRTNLKKGGIIAPERTNEQIDEEISQEAPLPTDNGPGAVNAA